MDETEIHAAAIAEILNPTLALTKQFLAVNKVVMKGNRPIIEDVIFQKEKQIFMGTLLRCHLKAFEICS